MSVNPASQAMLYDANKKSTGVAYLLWLFLGTFGAHRFYAGKVGSGIAILALTFIGLLLSVVGIGFFLLFVSGVWVLVDAFLIPGWIRNTNNLLVASLTNTGVPIIHQ